MKLNTRNWKRSSEIETDLRSGRDGNQTILNAMASLKLSSFNFRMKKKKTFLKPRSSEGERNGASDHAEV